MIEMRERSRVGVVLGSVGSGLVCPALQAKRSESSSKLSDGLFAILSGVESTCIFGVYVKRPGLLKEWFVEIPGENVFGWDPWWQS